jgi:esterase/lipase superfamily enzyme
MVAFIALLVTACSSTRYLMPTPYIYDGNNSAGFETLSLPLRTSNIDLLYVTDRKPEPNDEHTFSYGYKRSLSMAFGSVMVLPGVAVNWNQLVEASQTSNRLRKIKLSIGNIIEQGRYPKTPYPLLKDEEGLVRQDPASFISFDTINSKFQAELSRRIAMSPRKEVFIYIHGYNNSFADAAYTLAELWHFSGRETVPILYSWPAGRGGFSGYG